MPLVSISRTGQNIKNSQKNSWDPVNGNHLDCHFEEYGISSEGVALRKQLAERGVPPRNGNWHLAPDISLAENWACRPLWKKYWLGLIYVPSSLEANENIEAEYGDNESLLKQPWAHTVPSMKRYMLTPNLHGPWKERESQLLSRGYKDNHSDTYQ